jgi:putative transposase
MVAAVRRGQSLHAVARQFKVSVPTVQRWRDRAKGQRLDRLDFRDRSCAPHTVANRTPAAVERLILDIRTFLKDESPLGEFGAQAIQTELRRRRSKPLPSLRTIGNILSRYGALDYRRRRRFPAPTPGWYLPAVARGLAELDEWDFVEGLRIGGGPEVEVLNVISLHGGLAGSFPQPPFDTDAALQAILKHWREVGLPDYAQFDNDTRFTGPHQHADTIGRIIKLCLALGVVPVFAPPREHGLQNGIESYNGRWQEKVWSRFHFEDLAHLQQQSQRYVAAYRKKKAARRERAPRRRPFPKRWQFDAQAKVSGRIIFIRRSGEQGAVEVLGHQFAVDEHWLHRLVRCEVDIAANEIRFYALRRREPSEQPLLGKVSYQLPSRYIKT